MLAARVVDVEHALVRREREPIGQHEVVDEQGIRAEIGGEAVDTGEGEVPLLGREGAGPRIGEVDAAVRLDHHVVGTIEPLSLETVREDREAAVELQSCDPPTVVLAGDQPALQVARQPVGAVRRLEEQRHTLAGDVLHPLVVVDVAEE